MKFFWIVPVVLSSACLVFADEGMWTFDNPPLKQLQSKYGFTPTAAWLDHIRLSSVRLNDGGSGSFISPRGLILTNHHVARGQLQKNSTAAHDYIRDGFYAATPDKEMKSPDLEVNVLVSMENVTSRVQAAANGNQSPEAAFSARKSAIAAIEKESTDKTGLRSDVVTLYQGGEYWQYRYKKYNDVRLVFAPEQQMAFFGGDPDNFTYPRYDLDMALFRVYENGRPLETKDYLTWNPAGPKSGDLTFVSGHPGTTSRQVTMAQLTVIRDVRDPSLLRLFRSRVDALEKYSALGPEQARKAGSMIFNVQNGLKSVEGESKGLLDPHAMAAKQKDEDNFRGRVLSNPAWKQEFGGAWDQIAAAEKKSASRAKEQYFHATDSRFAALAANIVDYVTEIKKPDGERMDGYHDSQLESLRFQMLSPAPIYPDLEIARMTAALQLDLAEVGPNDPFVKIALNGMAPAQAAQKWIGGTELADLEVRRKLIEGGEAAVAASADPMIVLQRRLDPLRRELIKWTEDNVARVEQPAGQQLGKARFAVYGRTAYPDATFTLRLSYGQVKGYPMNGTEAPPFTTYYGLFDRAASFSYLDPFALTSRYLEGRTKLDLSTPLNFVTTNDVVGGNSGSPVINRSGEIVGLVFDGNIESLVGDFVYDETTNRTVAVTTSAMTEALKKLYGAQQLLSEITGK